ncbi:MAG: glycosyltransferase family 4 protein [Anaerolineales bacterium]|nr:glycosyltransferase family 4 protein [Anaerolineales bacterium]
MKVLLLTQVLPYPPDSGPKVKTWNVLKYLARQHEVTLASFVRGDQSAEVEVLRRYCRAVHTVPMTRSPSLDGLALLRSLATGRPWMMVRDDRAVMRRLVDRLRTETHFSIVHADQLNMAQYAMRVPGARKVLDAHNALWLLYKRLAETMPFGPRRWLLERDWRLLKEYEGRRVREFDAVLAVSDEDRAALIEAAGQPRDITVIPIAVDTDEIPVVRRTPQANHLLHIGTMYWPPNIDGMRWFIKEVYPLIRAQRSDVALDVVGARPPQELAALNRNGQNINVTGYVKDPQPYLERAGVFIVPLRAGGGMRVKILEALARGLPLVTTTLGCEGIAVEHGRHVLIADTPEAFARETLRLLNDRALADELGRAGRRLIEEVYDYRAACRPLHSLYEAAHVPALTN